MSKAINADGLKQLLRSKYTSRGSAFIDELRLGTGFSKDAQRYMDGWAMLLWGDLETIAFEIKISRSDFQHEMRKPNDHTIPH